MSRRKHFVCYLMYLCVLSAWGQEKADTTLHIDEVEVYGKRPLATAQKLSGADLQALSTTSVADALKYFSGVQIKDYGGLGGLKTINVRSMGAQHVGVYVDGIRITNAQNGIVDLGKFSLSSMESVTLYNANKLDNCQSASEYASGATVYLRTRRPTNDSVSVQLRRASFSTWTAKANVQFTVNSSQFTVLNGWQGFIDGEWTDSRGDYPFRYHSEYEDTVGRRANSDIRYGRIEGALFKGGFSSHLYYYDSERGCPGGIVRRLSDKYINVGREWDRDFFVQASYQQEFAAHHRVKVNAKYTNEYLRYCTDYPENQNTARVDNHYRQEDGYGALCYGYMPWSWLSLSTSYDVRYSKLRADLKRFDNVFRLDQKKVVAAQMNLRGVQAAASMLHQHLHDFTFVHAGAADPLDRWTPAVSVAYTVQTSGRRLQTTDFRPQTSDFRLQTTDFRPQTTDYRPQTSDFRHFKSNGELTIRAWYKKIFRAPTLNDLYYTQVGNRNLQPEYTKQWNIGIEWHWTMNDHRLNRLKNNGQRSMVNGQSSTVNGQRSMVNGQSSTVNGQWSIDLQADVYQNKIENRIVCLPMKGTYTWSMTNYGYTFCRGLNATAKGRYATGAWSFSLLGSLTWQRDLNRTDPDDEDTYNKPICYSPTLSYTLTGILGWRNLQLTTSYMHVGERMWSYADPEDILTPYNNIDAKLSYTLNLSKSHRLLDDGQRTAAPGPCRGGGGIIKSLGLCLEVCDLLDEQYEHIPRYPMPGRNYKLTLTLGI
jgi:outer membrane cobalamin receptor